MTKLDRISITVEVPRWASSNIIGQSDFGNVPVLCHESACLGSLGYSIGMFRHVNFK